MGQFLDTVPFSGIIRIRDMMYGVKDPFRLDQGDVSFDVPETVKAGDWSNSSPTSSVSRTGSRSAAPTKSW